jgi:hypothetical protein
MNTEKLDRVVRQIVTRWGIPGLGVGISDAESIVFAEGYGWCRCARRCKREV